MAITKLMGLAGALGLLLTAGASGALQSGGVRTATLDQMAATGAPAIRGFQVGLRGQCGGASPRAARDAIQAADLNGDGQIDFLVNMQGMTCEGRPMPGVACGQNACPSNVFLSQGGDYQRVEMFGTATQIANVGGRWSVFSNGQQVSLDDPGAYEEPAGSLSRGGSGGIRTGTWSEVRALRAQSVAAYFRDVQQGGCSSSGRSSFSDGEDGVANVNVADLNGDGVDDYLLSTGEAFTCDGMHGWCGNRGGCRYDVLISNGRDYIHEENIRSIEVALVEVGGRTLVLVPQDDGSNRYLGWNGRELATTSPEQVSARPPSGSTQTAGGSSFRDGIWGRDQDCHGEFAEDIEISGQDFVSNNMADSDQCRIMDRRASEAVTRLSIQCLRYCGNGADYCPQVYDNHADVLIESRSPDRISLRVEGQSDAYWNGDYAYCGVARR